MREEKGEEEGKKRGEDGAAGGGELDKYQYRNVLCKHPVLRGHRPV
jgi:hypothetical protein